MEQKEKAIEFNNKEILRDEPKTLKVRCECHETWNEYKGRITQMILSKYPFATNIQIADDYSGWSFQ